MSTTTNRFIANKGIFDKALTFIAGIIKQLTLSTTWIYYGQV